MFLFGNQNWYDMLANERTLEETAENWDLPVEAVEEIVRYCEANRELIVMEEEEEKFFLQKSKRKKR